MLSSKDETKKKDKSRNYQNKKTKETTERINVKCWSLKENSKPDKSLAHLDH